MASVSITDLSHSILPPKIHRKTSLCIITDLFVKVLYCRIKNDVGVKNPALIPKK